MCKQKVEALIEKAQSEGIKQVVMDYAEAMQNYLNKEKFSEDVITIVLKGYQIDQGASLIDYIESAKEKKRRTIANCVRTSKAIKNDQYGLLLLMDIHQNSLQDLEKFGWMFNTTAKLILEIIGSYDGGMSIEEAAAAFLDVGQLRKKDLPDWNLIDSTPELIKEYITVITPIIDSMRQSDKRYVDFYLWLLTGDKFADSALKKKAIEESIPKSKIGDLELIVEHYRSVENKLRATIFELNSLNEKIADQDSKISNLQNDLNALNTEKQNLQSKLDSTEKELEKQRVEIEERKHLNDAQSQFRVDAEKALLDEIARSLKPEFEDFMATKDQEISEMLGCIYREKLSAIAKLLEQKGIMVQK